MYRLLATAFLVGVAVLASAQDEDPAVGGKFTFIGNSTVVGVQLVVVPGTTQFFFMERPSGNHPGGGDANAALFDSVTGKSWSVQCRLSLENCGHSYLENGTIAVLAGHKPQSSYVEGRRGVQLLDLEARALREVGSLQFGHWLATVTRLPSGRIAVMSDSPSPVGPIPRKDLIKNPFYEVWDPENPVSTDLHQLEGQFLSRTKYFYYPFNFILPTGDMFVWSNNYGQIIRPETGEKVMVLPSWLRTGGKGIFTAYPFSGSAVMLPLRPGNGYKVAEIVVFGGQWSYGWINTTAVAKAMRLKIQINDDGSYDVGQWAVEDMPSPRVSGSAVLLPNGQVLLINGAQRGLLGDAAAGGVAMLNEPNFRPVLYDPEAAPGLRFTTLARSQIARLLHSTAGLTLDGGVLVAGGDRSKAYTCSEPHSPSPWGFPEFRVEVFSPPFVFDTPHRPVITSTSDPFRYGETDIITFTLEDPTANVTSVVLVAPSSDTHGFNMHQRVVELEILAYDTDNNHRAASQGQHTVTVRAPPSAAVAPAGPYMLYLVAGTTYGPGVWVKVAREEA
ncbi:hypothetical protein HYH03_015532 [Edaphochlamys debaryana]|uniref:Galactose oxidase-like Early set domain-containing protein n=1 Tax=Edaphochlamys debaryana TaxID=47281 RepID=A0A835XJD5_9CHLO|nr:hypothetical protein HYH03_015532 [Edaphochlamys debaryana]|eukprot:KAG2485822.1 hypothetical protein HYH03_015532 [Edaphochlamys debaryana]